MGKPLELEGQVFGMLTVLSAGLSPNKDKQRYWYCLCECGSKILVPSNVLVSGRSRSCGCARRMKWSEEKKKNLKKHGGYGTAEYGAWTELKRRCTDPRRPAYKDYGGRGISFDPRWREFEAFLEDMGTRPSSRHSIDRIDVNGDYNKDNCRWALPKEQCRNRRNNRLLTLGSESKCLSEWAEIYGISKHTVADRLELGWSVKDALTTPLKLGQTRKKDRKEAEHKLLVETVNKLLVPDPLG